MPIDVNALQNLMDALESLALRTKNGDLVSVLTKSTRFLPDTSVERDREVLDNNQNSSFQFGHCGRFSNYLLNGVSCSVFALPCFVIRTKSTRH